MRIKYRIEPSLISPNNYVIDYEPKTNTVEQAQIVYLLDKDGVDKNSLLIIKYWSENEKAWKRFTRNTILEHNGKDLELLLKVKELSDKESTALINKKSSFNHSENNVQYKLEILEKQLHEL